ncbi:Protein dltB [Bacillus thuringiensis serovar israelensis ATCC 35646]|nr:Protein dltB [Bacillus thuringiensis serovar israelensis ATCC 35646]
MGSNFQCPPLVLFLFRIIFGTKNTRKHKFWPYTKFTRILAIVITFHVVCFGFLIFSGHLNRYF